MKLSLNGATTMKADLVTDIRAAAAAGFNCVEIWAAKLRVPRRSSSVDVQGVCPLLPASCHILATAQVGPERRSDRKVRSRKAVAQRGAKRRHASTCA